MDIPVQKIHEAIEELRLSLVDLDGRSQLQLLSGSTAAAARLRVDTMRVAALELLAIDLQDEVATPASSSDPFGAELGTAG